MTSKTHRYIAYRRRKRGAHRTPALATALIALAGLGIMGIGTIGTITYSIYRVYANDLIPPEAAIARQPGGARILDRNGKLLYEFLDPGSGLNDPVKIEDISPWLVFATVAREDTSFFDNPGVNYRGMAAAVWENFWPFGSASGPLAGRGGSSITQQLVKNIYFQPGERSQRSMDRKVKETVYALELTERYPGLNGKKQIMEWYLNQISYGSVYIGAEKASEGYFGKPAKDLTLSEAAMLAAIPASPSDYSPIDHPEQAIHQRNLTLKSMYDEHYIDGAQLWEAVAQPLVASVHAFSVSAPHFVFNVVQPQLEALLGEEALKSAGLVVYTTIDLDLENKAQSIINDRIAAFEYSHGHNGAVVAIEPSTGEILVYIGSRNYLDENIQGQNDMAQALNSPGSSFKPFTYSTAFSKLNWGPGTLILDTPIAPRYWDGGNPPRNPVPHSGPISVRKALGNSLNIPAIKTILYTSVPEVVKQAKKFGITTLDGRNLGPSLTVGGVDVKLLDMTYAYTVFPNLGVLRGVQTRETRPAGNRSIDPVSILRVEDREGNILYPIINGQPSKRPAPLEERVESPAVAYMMNDILSDPNDFCLTYGCGGLHLPGRKAAFKTGTSEPFENSKAIGDTWTFAYTPQMVVGSWFGNADNSPMLQSITSTSVSYQISRDVLADSLKDKPNVEFERPSGLVRARACMPSGKRATAACALPTAEDWFAEPISDDTWWTTPPWSSRRVLRIPEGIKGFAREDALEWQSVAGR